MPASVRLSLALLVLLGPARLRAQPAPMPNPDALDFAPVDLLTVDLGIGLAAGFDTAGSGAELRAGFLAASVDALGLGVRVLRFQALGRPTLGTTSLAASLATVDAWMVGASNVDSSLCAWWPGTLCDGSTGFVGLAGSLLSVAHDTGTGRTGLRVAELAVVASPTPAFGASWSRFRFLPRAGIAADGLWRSAGGGDGWFPRLIVGFDSRARFGSVSFEPSLRWSSTLTNFTGDVGVEASLRLVLRTGWQGLSASGDAVRLSFELGYAYFSRPGTAFSADQVLPAQHSGFLRLVVAPSLISIAPP